VWVEEEGLVWKCLRRSLKDDDDDGGDEILP